MIATAINLPDRRQRTSLPICVILVIAFPILVTTDAGKREYGNTYERKTEDNREFAGNTKQSKHDGNENSMVKSAENRGRASDENGSALNRFLEDVLKAQEDLKWIDHVVRNSDRRQNWDRPSIGSNKDQQLKNFDSTSSKGNKKIRDKRSFLWNTDANKYSDSDRPELPRRVYIDSDMPSSDKNMDLYDGDTFQNGIKEKEASGYKSGKSLNGRDGTDDQLPKEWSKAKDICLLNDWLNSNKNFKTELDKGGDRWFHNYESDRGNQLNPLKTGPRVNARYQRDEAKNAESPSLESLKETILELKKSLNEDDKHRASTRAKNKQKKHEKDDDSNWWDSSESEIFDLKKREEDPDDFKEKNTRSNAWRRKRTDVNNEDDGKKLFHRAGFGEPYLEEKALKELHDRKRRSKGIPSEEKDRSNEPCDDKNNLLTDEKDSLKLSKETHCHDLDDVDKKKSNDLRANYAIERGGKSLKNFEDTSSSIHGGKSSGVAENYDRVNRMENESTKNGEKDDSPGIFGSTPNELQPVSDQISTPNKDDAGKVEEAKTRRDKVFEHEDGGTNNDETNAARRRDVHDEKRGKSLQERSLTDGKNINILMKSENKNLIKFSNTAANGNSRFDGEQPFMLNRLDMKKKLYMENEENAGKSVATVYNVKIEKAQLDTPVQDNSKQEGEKPIPCNLGKIVASEFDGNKQSLLNDMKQRNVDEERIRNSVEINKGSTERSGNEGTQSWYKNNNRFSTIDQNSVEKDQLENRGENLNDNRVKESNDKANSNDASNADLADKSTIHERSNNGKNTQIVIVPEGLDDRKLSDMYSQRRILQYMEYSDDDVEDADASYSDKEEEEEESQRQAIAEKSGAASKRKERSPVSDKGKARVNVMIKEKMDKKKHRNGNNSRKRRNPVSVIEYYDYDSDNEQREHEADEQDPSKTGYGKNSIESDLVLGNTLVDQTFIPPAKKKNEHEEEMRKEQVHNEPPKQEFIVQGEPQPANSTEKTEVRDASLSAKVDGSSLEDRQKQSGRLNQGEDNVNAISRGRLDQPISEREDKTLEGGAKDSATYILNADEQSNPDAIDVFLEDIRSMDEKNEKMPNNFEPLYEELKKIYDWNQDESISKPRIKGDHRMYYGANDKLDPINKMSESYAGQIELPETQGRAIADPKTCSTKSSDYTDNESVSNVSRSNYFALKSTDDLFKGGSEQSNVTEQKLRGPSSIGGAVEWREQKVSGASTDATTEKDARSRSLTGRGQYIDTDSRSPYGNRKYLESRLPRERVQNIDRGKQTVISSGDLHESFVEPLDWIDDFDEDTRPRLSRSLKTIDQKTPESSSMVRDGLDSIELKDGENRTSTLITERNLLNASIDISKVRDTTTKMSTFEDSRLSLRYPLDLRDLFDDAGHRVKRNARPFYDTSYDDSNRFPADSEKLGYYEYSRNRDETNDLRSSMSEPNAEIEEEEDENYGKIARREKPKKKKQHGNRKHRHSGESKKKKKKSHGKKSKYSNDSDRRKRRHPKKHSSEPKTKRDHGHKKHKKRAPKTSNPHGKKGKLDDKIRDVRKESSANERKTRRDKMDNEHTMNNDNDAQKKISSLLSIDNVEDESQMDSALHGELAGKIVDHIFEQVQKNEDLKASLGPGLYQKHKTRDTASTYKTYRQALNDDESNHSTELLNQIMLLLNRLIFDEVQRKTCVSLSPDLTEFLDWILDVNPRRNSMEQLPSLPLVHAINVPNHFPKDKFLFHDSTSNEVTDEFNELREKLRLVEKLINEYRTLSEQEKAKVQSVHDYLSNQLDLLFEYVRANEKEISEFPGGAKGKTETILHYEGGMTNASNGDHSKRPNMVIPSINESNSKAKKVLADEDYFHEGGLNSFRKGRRTIRSLDMRSQPRKKHRKHKKKHRHKGRNAIDQPAHKDTVHKAASRQKREYLDKEFRDSIESEYEEPLIYSSMDFENVESERRDVRAKGSLKDENGENALIDKTEVKVLTNRKNAIGSGISGANDGVKKRDAPKRTNSFDAIAGKSDSMHGELKSNIADMGTGEKMRDALVHTRSTINEKRGTDAQSEEEEPIMGKDQLEDEIILLNKRQSWKKQNEEQLEELAFGEDMRKGLKEKELFEKLTEIDKKMNSPENAGTKETDAKEENPNCPGDCTKNDHGGNCNLSDENKLRMLEEKINVYSE